MPQAMIAKFLITALYYQNIGNEKVYKKENIVRSELNKNSRTCE